MRRLKTFQLATSLTRMPHRPGGIEGRLWAEGWSGRATHYRHLREFLISPTWVTLSVHRSKLCFAVENVVRFAVQPEEPLQWPCGHFEPEGRTAIPSSTIQ